jgi:hypothetical protein
VRVYLTRAVVFVLGTVRRIPQSRPSYFYHDRLIDKRPGRIVVLVFKANPVLVRSPVPPVYSPLPSMAPNTTSDHATVEQTFKTHWDQAYAALQPLVSPEDDTPPRKEAIDQFAAAVVSSSTLPLRCVLTGVFVSVERLRAYSLGHVCVSCGELGPERVRDVLSLGRRFTET